MADYAKVNAWLCVLLLVVNAVVSSSVFKRDVVQLDQQGQNLELDPVVLEGSDGNLYGVVEEGSDDRDKRTVKFAVVKKIGLKAVLLNFIFGKIDSFIDAKTNAIDQLDKLNIHKNQYLGIHPPPQPPKFGKQSGPAPVEFQTNSPVSLVIPDRLYGNSFSLITNVSNIIGDVLFNTADRAQELADRVNEKLKAKFGFKNEVFSIKTGSSSSGSS